MPDGINCCNDVNDTSWSRKLSSRSKSKIVVHKWDDDRFMVGAVWVLGVSSALFVL